MFSYRTKSRFSSHPISEIEKVEIVFKDGVGYNSGKLIQSVQGLVGIR